MKRASLVGVLGLLSFALVPATGALAAQAAPAAAGPVTYHGTIHQVARTALTTNALTSLRKAARQHHAAATTKPRLIPFLSPGGHDPANHSAKAQAARVHSAGITAAGYTVGTTEVSPVHQFNGLSDLDQATLNGAAGTFDVTPPDQGLCVGQVSGIKGNLVVEMVNSAVVFATPTGTPVLAAPLFALFNDNFAQGDPRCLYDPATKSFYFTEIGYPAGGPSPVSPLPLNTTLDVAVLHGQTLANYQFDTSLGDTCFGDQPKTGFSNTELVVSTDEYCGTGGANYEGAIVLALNKSQLVAGASTVSEDLFGPVSLAGIPGLGLDPAINTGTKAGYLVNSFPFDATGANNAVSSSLGLWSINGDTLTGRLLSSESYAFPVPAVSTGDGTTTAGITSEAFLNPDDSRLSGPVNVTHTSTGVVQLWTALDSAIAPKGDPTARDGAAWFRIDTGLRKVVGQGYVATPGAYLLYPAVQKSAAGFASMVFTVTSSSINPSAAYTTLGSGAIKLVAAGSGPHLSFSDAPPFFQPRWGDYSFTSAEPGGNGIWMATEYIPPKADWDTFDNWGTYVFEVNQ